MKILQINKFFYVKGGAERYFFDLIKLLENKGHEVIPFSMQDEKNERSKYEKYFVSKVEFSRPGLKSVGRIIYSREAKKKLEALIKETKPELAHLHNIAHQISPSILSILKKHKIPVVQTLHDYKLICPNYRLFTQGQVCEKCKKYKYYHAKIHKCLKDSYWASALGSLEMYVHKFLRSYEKNVDLFIAPSQFMKDKCVEFGQNPEQFVVLPYTFNISDYQPKYDWDEKEKYLVYFGRLAKEKGVDVLIEAMRELKDVKLKIIGQGPEQKELEIINYKLGNKNVFFVGHKSGKELHDLIRGAMFAVVPSIWYENSPLVIYETFALGRPVVGSKIGGIPELVEDNKTGLLFKPGSKKELVNKIQGLIDKPEKIVKMGRSAREKIEKLANPEGHYKNLMKIYEKTL